MFNNQQNSINQHGGNIFEIARRKGVPFTEIVDLSSNVAYAFPEAIKSSLLSNFNIISHLPEPYSQSVSLQIANHYKLSPSHLILGAGTTELIQWICYFHASQTVLIIQPTYSDYEKYATLYGCQMIHHILKKEADFRFYKVRIHEEVSQANVAFICNPNNPTGRLINRSILLSMISEFPRTLFVVDESYIPFIASESQYSLLGNTASNLIVLRSMSKIYGIPGIRLGWLYSVNEPLVGKFKEAVSPWSVNSLAQMIATQLLKYDISELREEIQKNKEDFLRQIADFKWLHAYPTEANYVLLKSSKLSATELFNYFYQAHILIRNCDNFRGLDSSFIRVSIKDVNSMERAINVLKEIDSAIF